MWGEIKMNLEISQFPIGEKNPYGQYFDGQSYSKRHKRLRL